MSVFIDKMPHISEKCHPNAVCLAFFRVFFDAKTDHFSCNNHWHSVIKTRKIFFKNLAETLAEKEKASTFAPAFERERVLKNGLGEIKAEEGKEETNMTPFEKR